MRHRILQKKSLQPAPWGFHGSLPGVPKKPCVSHAGGCYCRIHARTCACDLSCPMLLQHVWVCRLHYPYGCSLPWELGGLAGCHEISMECPRKGSPFETHARNAAQRFRLRRVPITIPRFPSSTGRNTREDMHAHHDTSCIHAGWLHEMVESCLDQRGPKPHRKAKKPPRFTAERHAEEFPTPRI